MFTKGRLLLISAALGTLSLGSCTDPNPRLPVNGSVMFNGIPLDHGNIQFLTTVGPPGPAAGGMIKDGKYSIPAVHGLEPGTYRVLISSSVPAKVLPEGWAPGASRPTEERIPVEFSSFEKSKVLVEVKPPAPVVLDFTIP